MNGWLNPATFAELDVFEQMEFLVMLDFDPDWVNHTLDRELHPELYPYFEAGGKSLYRANSSGRLEFIVNTGEVSGERLASCSIEIRLLGTEYDRFFLELLLTDEDKPLLVAPFVFELSAVDQRYCVAALCEQPQIPLFFVNDSGDRIEVLFCRQLAWSDDVRVSLRDSVIENYVNYQEAKPEGIWASTLKEEETSATGRSYHFDLHLLRKSLGEKTLEEFIEEFSHVCATLIADSKHAALKKGTYLFWVHQAFGMFGAIGAEREGLIIFITPNFQQAAIRAKKNSDPCLEWIQSVPGFLRVLDGDPVWENALPAFRYSHGEFEQVLVDQAFLEFALQKQVALMREYEVTAGEHDSLYRNLLADESGE